MSLFLLMGAIDDAIPAKYFNNPPFRAELFAYDHAGVINVNGINCLTFKSKPGAVLTSFENAKSIVERWNNEA